MVSSSRGLAVAGAAVAALAWPVGTPQGTTAVVQAVPAPPVVVTAPPVVETLAPTESPTLSPTPSPSPSPAPKPPASPVPSIPPYVGHGILVVRVVDSTGATLDRSYVVTLYEGGTYEGDDFLHLPLEHGYFAFDVVKAGPWLVYSPGCDGEDGTADDLEAHATVFRGQSTDVPLLDKPCPPAPTPTGTGTPSGDPSETPPATPSATATPSP